MPDNLFGQGFSPISVNAIKARKQGKVSREEAEEFLRELGLPDEQVKRRLAILSAGNREYHHEQIKDKMGKLYAVTKEYIPFDGDGERSQALEFLKVSKVYRAGEPKIASGEPIYKEDGTEVKMRAFDDTEAIRNNIFDSVAQAAVNAPHAQNQKYTLALTDAYYADEPKYTRKDIYQARMKQSSLGRTLRGTWRLYDTQTGQELQKSTKTIAHVPYLTDDGTFIMGGSAYSLRNQMRLKPGPYVKKNEDGTVETQINTLAHEGMNHNYELDPEKGVFSIRANKKKYPFYLYAKAMGASEEELQNLFGDELHQINKKYAAGHSLKSLYKDLVPTKRQSDTDDDDEKMSAGIAKYLQSLNLAPEVSNGTLKKPYANISKELMMDAAVKMLRVYRGEEDEDSRDALPYQKLMGAEDLLAEPVQLDDMAVKRKMLSKLTYLSKNNPDLSKIPTGALDKSINAVLQSSGLAQPIEETNPLDAFNKLYSVTRLGRGAMSGVAGIPASAREVNDSQFGFIDPLQTAESLRAGVDLYAASAAKKGSDGNLYIPVINTATGQIEHKSTIDLQGKNYTTLSEYNSGNKRVPGFEGGKLTYGIKKGDIQYILPSDTQAYSYQSNLIPMLNNVKGQRVSMAARQMAQSLPLVDAEAPLVQSKIPGQDTSFENLVGSRLNVRAKESGVVTNVTDDQITVQTQDGKENTYDLDKYLMSNRKTFSHHTPLVKPGDVVQAGQHIAQSNYADRDGNLALSKNARIAVIPWRGKNNVDAIGISESFAKKMTSLHGYTTKAEWDDSYKRGKGVYASVFPGKYDTKTMENIDDNGVVKIGTTVKHNDPLILRTQVDQSPVERLAKKKANSFIDQSIVWDHEDEGVVTDVYDTPKGTVVNVKSQQAMKEADKLSNRFGAKGVVTIIPDEQMPIGPDGQPVEAVFSTIGNIGRVNYGMLHELALSKIAKKNGKPISMDAFDSNNPHTAEYVDKLLKEHGLSAKETLIDPATGKEIPDVAFGYGALYKLHHSAEYKESSRGITGGYTADEQIRKGGDNGGKSFSLLTTNAMLSHGAYNVIDDAMKVRGQKNDEYWSAFMRGYDPPDPKQPAVYKQFLSYMSGSGINIVPKAGKLQLLALTNGDVKQLSQGRQVQSADTMDWEKNQKPIRGGLFDPEIFGEDGTRWASYKLASPILNPVMEGPARSLLGLTQEKFGEVLSGRQSLPGYGSGTEAVKKALSGINIDTELAKERRIIANERGSKRDAAVKRLAYLKSAKENDINPGSWILDEVPIIPPKFRPISLMNDGTPLVNDANYLYAQLISQDKPLHKLKTMTGAVSPSDNHEIYKRFKEVAGLSDPEQMKLAQKGVTGLLGHVFGKGSSKWGMMQRSLYSKPTNNVSLNVITPDSKLDIDEVGIPYEQAYKVYNPYIIRNLVKRGYPLTTAKEIYDKRGKEAKIALYEETQKSPVIMQRQPLLHKFGVLAMYPKLIQGNNIAMNTAHMAAFAGDYDGDGQINNVICRINKDEIKNIAEITTNSFDRLNIAYYKSSKLLTHLEENMKTRTSVLSCSKEDYITFSCDLSNFPHMPERANQTHGKYGDIDWFPIPDGIEVLAQSPDGNFSWVAPTVWSVHHNMPVEIVNLSSGKQIITDDDPRAVYGIDPETLEYVRDTPDNAKSRHIMVPTLKQVPYPEDLRVIDTSKYIREGDSRHIKPEILADADLGYVLGAMAGDGWVTLVHTQLSVNLADYRGITYEKVNAVFQSWHTGEVPAKRIESKESWGKSARYIWCAAELGAFLRDCIGHRAENKKLPNWIQFLSKECCNGILAGLLDTDGSVSIQKRSDNGKRKLDVRYTTSSIQLVNSIRVLCMKLGIRCGVTATKSSTSGNPAYDINFSKMDMIKWDCSMLQDKDKIAALQSGCVAADSPSAQKLDIIPVPTSITNEVINVCNQRGPTAKKIKETFRNTRRQDNHASRSCIKKQLELMEEQGLTFECELKNKWLKLIEDTDIIWNAISSVEKTGIIETGYDLTVPGPDTFVSSDGVVLSNTMTFQVPATQKAREEAVELMLPSKNMFSVLDGPKNAKPMYTPAEYQYVGNYALTRETKESSLPPKVFRNKADAISAFKRGEISPQRKVKILE